jgi:hypothetical protein
MFIFLLRETTLVLQNVKFHVASQSQNDHQVAETDITERSDDVKNF